MPCRVALSESYLPHWLHLAFDVPISLLDKSFGFNFYNSSNFFNFQ